MRSSCCNQCQLGRVCVCYKKLRRRKSVIAHCVVCSVFRSESHEGSVAHVGVLCAACFVVEHRDLEELLAETAVCAMSRPRRIAIASGFRHSELTVSRGDGQRAGGLWTLIETLFHPGTSSSGWLDFLLLDCCRALVCLRLCLWKVLRPPSHCLSLVLCFFCLSLSLILAGCWLGAVQMPNAQRITIRTQSFTLSEHSNVD